jgi:hypothetical protein
MKIGLMVQVFGSASLLSLVMRCSASEIVVIDRNPQRAKGVVADLR